MARVLELAKEFGISNKEMLAKLVELGIPVKTHASVLSEADEQKVRDHLDPEIKQRTGHLEKEEAEALAKKQAEEQAKKEAEEAQRRAAVEHERQMRKAERAKRMGTEPKHEGNELIDFDDDYTDSEYVEKGTNGVESLANEAQEPKPSAYQGLAEQIEANKQRAEREAREAAARKKAEERARDVAKKQEVEAALRGKGSKKVSVQEPKEEAPAKVSSPKTKTNNAGEDKQSKPRFDALRSQIEKNKARMDEESADKSSAQGSKDKKRQRQDKNNRADSDVRDESNERAERAERGERGERDGRADRDGRGGRSERDGRGERENRDGRGGRGVKKKTNQRTRVYDHDYYDAYEDEGPDRYAQMAASAEKLQLDRVLADARAAVAEAASHDGEGRRKKRKEKREAQAREKAEQKAIERGLDPSLVLDSSVIEVPQGTTVSKLAELIKVQPNEIIKRLFMLGQVLTLTQSMSDELIELVADDLGAKVRVVSPEEEYAVVYNDSEEDLKPRPPVVTVMGHVDHGKTSLLDAIRHTGVAEGEAGGITQHIGASVVNLMDHQITFIDTPGHEAFTAMRARGAQVTDVIVLVVAADDGVMPQTIEAINHAKAAGVPIVVAVNKVDKAGANPDRVRQELSNYDVIPEEWGGQNMFVDVSAKQKLHIDDLLETILLQADVLDLKANPNALASGFVIEANLDKGRGPVATVLVQRGTLKPGDTVVAGTSYGRVRALVNPRHENVSAAYPADPVEILGLNSVPVAGDEFRVFEDERDARKLAEERALRARLAEQQSKSHMSLDDLFSRIEEGKQTDLNLIVKADVQGSIEALRDAFNKMDQSEVKINIVHSAVGGITETDVTLAAASDAIIIGFNVRPTGKSKQQAEKEKVDIRLYRVIYQALEDINAARVGLLKPEIVEKDTGIAEVRDVFKVPKVGNIAGCYVVEGEVSRDDKVRIVREGKVIFEGTLSSLRRFKDDVKSVRQGYECGIGVNGYQDIKVGDTIEGYRIEEVERTE